MGLHIVAGKGAGKSRLLGRKLAFEDFTSPLPYPILIIDPQGVVIDNFLDKLRILPQAEWNRLRHRLLYADMSGKTGYVPQFPLYYRLPTDTLEEVAMRFPNLVNKLDPAGGSAPVRGQNAISTIGRNVGMLLAELNLPISEAPSLLNQTASWHPRLMQLRGEAEPAVNFFLQDYPKSRTRREQAESFLSKLEPITHNKITKRMFATNQQSINWAQAEEEDSCVMLDFRLEEDPRFKILWALKTFLEYIKLRGPGHKPFSVIIDEAAFLLALESSGNDLLSVDFDNLINKDSRNNNVWLTIAHQEMKQIPVALHASLMGMGSQIIGQTSDAETAEQYARRFDPFNAYALKGYSKSLDRNSYAVELNPLYFPPQEQNLIHSYSYMNLKTFHFLLGISPREGTVATRLEPIDIVNLDPGDYFDEPLIKGFRITLARRSGVPVETAPSPPAVPADDTPRFPGEVVPEPSPGGFVPLARSETKQRTFTGVPKSSV